MKNEKQTEQNAAPRKLHKPVRDEQDLQREQLVTYAGENGGIQAN